MQLTPEQIKGRIKNLAKQNNADARTLIRVYMMERFLERVSNSRYKDNLIIKGGLLVSSMVGVALRSTMDIDTSIQNYNLSTEDARSMIEEINSIEIDDGIKFEIKAISDIMDDMEYPGIRISMNAIFEKLITPIKIDISTGDVITPKAIEYEYKLILEDRSINLWSYNLETILAEKLQTVLARGVLNTRMRDFYDINILLSLYQERTDSVLLRKAFYATCENRVTNNLADNAEAIISSIKDDQNILKLWNSYSNKYPYAKNIQFNEIINSIEELAKKVL